jgi:G3E family GTPase
VKTITVFYNTDGGSSMPEGPETELTVVCGADRRATAGVAAALRRRGAVLVTHDVRALGEGVVRRRVVEDDGEHDAVLELAHACLSCTLRDDLLPLLVRLARDPAVAHVVLLLDPGLEVGATCASLHGLVPEGLDAPVADLFAWRGVVSVLDAGTWLDDAGGDVALGERGRALTADDERTVAQMVVGQAEFADVLVVAGRCGAPWDRVRLDAVLARLAPRARQVAVTDGASDALAAAIGARLDDLPADARRGRPDHAHAPLLRGQPPLSRDAGVSLLHVGHRRPFHPERLHAAFDVLLRGTVRVRGRVWVASQPEHLLWLESAGGALQVGVAGPWLAADPSAWDDADDERRAAAAVCWDERWGDREQQVVALVHDADPATIVEALDAALLTDDELALGEDAWRRLPDPFGHRHVDPCDEFGAGSGVESEPGEGRR